MNLGGESLLHFAEGETKNFCCVTECDDRIKMHRDGLLLKKHLFQLDKTTRESLCSTCFTLTNTSVVSHS